jgi:3-hydroxybutyryl-CoA dehydratase
MSFTPLHLYFDDVAVGQEWDSVGRTITETDIVNFAGISGDFNPIHVDHEFARSTAFQRPIAHGLLTLSIAAGLAVQLPAMRTFAFVNIREWHFREPIFAGDTIHVRSKILEKAARGRGRRGTITWQRQVINQHGKVVQEGVTQTLVEGRANSERGAG